MELEPNWQAHSRMTSRDYQIACFEHLKGERFNAIFSDPGMGKTKTGIDLMCYHAMKKQIDTIILFAWPNGVHNQWVDEQIPKHWWKSVAVNAWAWDGNKVPQSLMMKPKDKVHFIALNIESTRSDKAMNYLHALADANGKNILLVVDESQRIKNNASVAWKELKALSEKCQRKMIMTGTPIAKTLLDEWAQFNFMDYGILKMRYKTAFQQQFCVMGGFNGREVIGSKNIEIFNKMIAPYTFRASKEQLNLPPKIYDELPFNLTQSQRNAQDELRQTLELELNRLPLEESATMNEIMRVVNPAVLYLKLQQIANGYVVDNDGNEVAFKENPRLSCVEDFVSIERENKIVVWARFKFDVKNLMRLFGDKAVAYYGDVDDEGKKLAKRRFINDDRVRYFVANQQSAGVGVDGLQDVSSTAIYYSQSFDGILRQQSEDRTNRFGSKYVSRYFDVVGRASIDRLITRNLLRKKSFSDLTLRDLKEAVRELQAQS